MLHYKWCTICEAHTKPPPALYVLLYMPPPVPRAGNAEPAAPCFVPRGGGEREGINRGLKEGRQSFIDFISQQPFAWYSSISDMQENVDLPQGGMKSKEQIHRLMDANVTNLPLGFEVIIYSSGQGEQGRDWSAYTMGGALIACNHGGAYGLEWRVRRILKTTCI